MKGTLIGVWFMACLALVVHPELGKWGALPLVVSMTVGGVYLIFARGTT